MTDKASAVDPTEFPLDSFREAAPYLRRPFTRNAVKFKLLRHWNGGGEVATYIDARLVSERLNLVIPDLWFDEYEAVAGGKGLLCKLTIDGITRRDVGEGYIGKGLYSDAFKRAAVKFGVGVSLYAIPAGKIAASDGDQLLIEKYKTKKGKEVATLTPAAVAQLRTRYAAWLDNAGVGIFGEPLDHGDVEGSAGDVETEVASASPVDDDATTEAEPLTDGAAIALATRAEELHKNVAASDMPKAEFNRTLESARSSMPDLEKLVAALEEMQS